MGICSLPHLPVTPAGTEVEVGIKAEVVVQAQVEAEVEAGALYREHTDG
jgi:hypothetical protein